MACLALACAVLAAAWGALCRPRGPNAGLCGPTAPVGHLCKRGTAAGPTLAGWKGADAPRRARRQGAVHGRDPSLRAALVSPLRRAPWWNPRGFVNVVALGPTASRAQGATHGAPNSCSRRRSSWRGAAACELFQTTSSCKLFCELCCTHPPTARARAYCGLRVLPATSTLHSCAQAQQTCQHGKILPVPHGSASCMGKLVWQAPSVLGVLEPVVLVWRPPRQQQSVTILSIHVIICCHGVAGRCKAAGG